MRSVRSSPVAELRAAGLAHLACPMAWSVRQTLDEIAELPHPVVRTSHLGNTPANNFGWLALARNSRPSPLAHTLFGVDDIYLPWIQLGDHGRVLASFDHRGQQRSEHTGLHANALRNAVPRKHRALLNFGLRAEHQGEDLISSHFRLTAEICRQWNGSEPQCRAGVIRQAGELIRSLVGHFHRQRRLHLLFNKWIATTRKGHVASFRLRAIEYQGNRDLRLVTTDGQLRFEGSVEVLLDRLLSNLAQVEERLIVASPLQDLGYPWITLTFNLLLNAVLESADRAEQRVFWHAVAATNHLYSRQLWFRQPFLDLAGALIENGYLPAGFQLRLIPTFSCQLFATNPASLPELEGLIACWRQELKRQGSTVVEAFENSAHPERLAERFAAEMSASCREALGRHLRRFNQLDLNRLPLAYEQDSAHPTYNKYGIAQRQLLGRRPHFPTGLLDLRWREAELLIKVLARLRIDQRH